MSHDLAVWRCHIQVAKFEGDWTPDAIPFAVDEYDGNMLMHGGVSALWQCLINPSTTLRFNTPAIGVGDSTTAESPTHNDLQGATNKLRKACDVGYPEHTDGLALANKTIRFRSTFDTTQANFTWAEAGVFSSATAGQGRMLNRKVQSMGLKTNTASWQVTFDIAIS